ARDVALGQDDSTAIVPMRPEAAQLCGWPSNSAANAVRSAFAALTALRTLRLRSLRLGGDVLSAICNGLSQAPQAGTRLRHLSLAQFSLRDGAAAPLGSLLARLLDCNGASVLGTLELEAVHYANDELATVLDVVARCDAAGSLRDV